MSRKKYRSATVTVDCEVYVHDVIDEISDDDLLEEVKARGLVCADIEMTMVRDAYDELLRGRPSEARSILDRLLNPKWVSMEACAKAARQLVLPTPGTRIK